MRISVFTDEICREAPERALALAKEWGLTHVEIRSLPGGRFPAVSDNDLTRFADRIKEAGLAVSGVSPGFFKCSLDDPSIGQVLSEQFPRACEWARRLGTDMVTCFPFRWDGSVEPPSEVVDVCGRMCEIANGHGCRLAIENEAGCWGATGIEAASLIRRIGAENIGLCWDPGNAAKAASVRPYPDEYIEIRDLVSHVHMKSFDSATDSWCLMNGGAVDWPGQLRALSEDGYGGFLVIETHLRTSPDGLRPVEESLSQLENNTFVNLQFVRSCMKQH